MLSWTEKYLLKNKPLAMAFFVLGMMVLWIGSWAFPIHDFGNYYFSAKAFVFESSLNIYDPVAFNQYARKTQPELFLNYSPHPPFAALIYLPFSFFEVTFAKLLFGFLGILALSISLWRFSKYHHLSPVFIYLIPIVFFIPIRNNLLFGQSYLFLTAFLLELYLSIVQEKTFKASIFLCLIILMKFNFILLFLFFISRKSFRTIIYTGLSLSILALVHISLVGTDLWLIFFKNVLPRAADGIVNVPFSDHFQSLNSLLFSLFRQDPVYNPNPFINSAKFYFFVKAFAIAFLIGLSFISFRKSKLHSFALWTLSILLITPIVPSYALLMLIAVLPLFFTNELIRFKWILPTMAVFISSNALFFVKSDWFVSLYPRLIGIMILTVILTASADKKSHRYAFTLALVFALYSLTSENRSSSAEVLLIEKNSARIAKALDYSNNQLSVNFLTARGVQTEKLKLDFEIVTAEELNPTEISHLLPSKDTPEEFKNGFLFNGNSLYYLSDKNHGYRFFQLNKTVL